MIWLLIVVGLVIWALSGRGASSNTAAFDVENKLTVRNQEWAQFIASYLPLAKTKAQKELLVKILADIESQGIVLPKNQAATADQPLAKVTLSRPELIQASTPTAAAAQKSKNQVQLDNASLLLYFGAFLFVASAGLFVAFGGLPGGLRTFIVLLVTLIMYGSGVWLFRNRRKLQQAGLALAGIGIAIAPLVGLTMYNYVFDKTDGSAVWLATSLLCLALYAHALFVLRKPLINYLFIFTFLSLFESGVSITSAPIYYFGWMMAFAGIILSAVSRIKGFWPEFQESSRMSGALFLPLALFVSLVMVQSHGAAQLGVSLLLAAAYYGLEFMSTTGEARQNNALAAQVALTASVAALSYAAGRSWLHVSSTLFIFDALELAILVVRSRATVVWQNFASVIMVTQLVGISLSVGHPVGVLATSAGLVVMAGVIWWRQRRTDAYVVAMLAWMALPVIFGQLVTEPKVSASMQAGLLLLGLFFQFFILVMPERKSVPSSWLPTAQQLYFFSSIAVLATSLFSSAWICLLVGSAVTLLVMLLAEREKEHDWSPVIGIFMTAPLFRVWDTPGAFLAATSLALLVNIAMALRHREESNRWLSTLLWLLLPVAVGSGILGQHWQPMAYAWAYVVAMLGLVFSRAIARGVVFVSSKIPLTSYARTASLSYVVGYWFAGGTAISLSLVADNSQLHATCVLAVIGLTVWLLSTVVEKNPDLLALLPLFAQAVLLSAIRPTVATDSIVVYLLLGSMLALTCYGVVGMSNDKSAKPVRLGSVVAIFVTPAAVLFVGQTLWPMPLGLLVAATLVYYHVRLSSQQNRELAGGLITAALFWVMSYTGVTAVQAYSHVLVALFAFYAYWRHTRNEGRESDQYLGVMLATATIPLVSQALGGLAGGLYGWWLLLEEIAFMIIGMAIGKRFLTRWGLYIAVAAVLYQLRDLGWAALTVLALFLIGLAVSKILKYQEK